MNKPFHARLVAVLFISALMVVSFQGSALGAGFALIEQSVTGLGNAFAGGAASAEDNTTIFFNPAGLTRVQGTQVTAGAHIVAPSAKFSNKGSTHALQRVTGVPLRGGDGGDAGVIGVVPNLYLSRSIGERLTIGLGINAPFGLETDYKDSWVGRYHAINSKVLTVNTNPTIAYKVTDGLSVGGGLSVQFIKAELSNAIDFGTLDAVGAFAPLGIPAGALGLIPQGSDGHIEMQGDDWGIGFNLGLLYEFTQSTRAGIAYRSRIKYTLEGDADFSDVPAGLAPAPLFKDADIEADVTMPDSLSVSVYHDINPEWAIMADVTWTNWSVFDELRIEFDNPFQADGVTTTDWDDNFRYSLGVTFRPNETWTFRAGGAYDETPIPSADKRTPRIPGSNRIWLAGGIGYRVSSLDFAFGYAHLFVDDAKIDKDPVGEDAVRGGLKGEYDSHVDIVSAQVSWTF